MVPNPEIIYSSFKPDDKLILIPTDKEGFWHFEESDGQLKITRVKK